MTTLIAAAFFAAQCVLKEEQEYGIHYCCRCCRGRHCLLLSLLQEGPADPGHRRDRLRPLPPEGRLRARRLCAAHCAARRPPEHAPFENRRENAGNGVKTKEGVSLWLDSVVTVQVYSENSTVSDEEVRNAGYDDIRKYINSRQQSAISNFLGMDEAHINEKINDVLQGNLREIVSEMTLDQILTNRKQMAVSVVENARPDLAKMGLEVVTFNVQDVKDAVDAMGHNHGVIEAIGVEQEELVQKACLHRQAEAERDVSCAQGCRRHGREREGNRGPDRYCSAQQRAGAGKVQAEGRG